MALIYEMINSVHCCKQVYLELYLIYEVITSVQCCKQVYLELEGVCVIGAWNEVCVDPGSSADLASVGQLLLQSQAASVAGAIRAAHHTT